MSNYVSMFSVVDHAYKYIVIFCTFSQLWDGDNSWQISEKSVGNNTQTSTMPDV